MLLILHLGGSMALRATQWYARRDAHPVTAHPVRVHLVSLQQRQPSWSIDESYERCS